MVSMILERTVSGINTMPAGREERIRRILIFRGGALGDFILTVPAITWLRRQSPGALITLAGRQAIAGLATASGLVDEFIPIDGARFAPYFARDADLPPEEKDWLRSFDRVISFVHDPDEILKANLLRNGARIIHCVSPLIESGHAIDHFLGGLGVETESGAAVRLELPADLVEKGRRLLDAIGAVGHVVAIHPGSGSAAKNWPLENFLELASRIEALGGYSVVFTAGEADEGIVEELHTRESVAKVHRRACPAGDKDLAKSHKFLPYNTLSFCQIFCSCHARWQETTFATDSRGSTFPLLRGLVLPQVAAVLSCCSCYVGNDSGITHLAAWLGLPVVALFGPTDPAMWAPRGEHVRVVAAPGGRGSNMEAISVTQVFDAVSSLLDLAPIDQ